MEPKVKNSLFFLLYFPTFCMLLHERRKKRVINLWVYIRKNNVRIIICFPKHIFDIYAHIELPSYLHIARWSQPPPSQWEHRAICKGETCQSKTFSLKSTKKMPAWMNIVCSTWLQPKVRSCIEHGFVWFKYRFFIGDISCF